MLYMCVMLGGMLCFWLAGYIRNSQIKFARSLILTFAFYFMFYVLVSAVLFVFDIFSIRYAVVGTSAICGIGFLINLGLLSRGTFSRNKEWVSEKDSCVSFVLIAFAAILTWGNFGFLGMGSDQGIYPTQAINFCYDKTERYQDIEEYEELEDTEYKAFYQEQIKADELIGYYLLLDYEHVPTVNVSNETGEAEGIWHGIPTYSAILGLSAKIFGMENMPFIGLLFYLCLLCMMEFILTDLNLSCWVRRGVVLLLGMSPQVVWSKDSTLTEGFIAVLIVTYIYYILHPDKGKRFWSVMPITTFGCFHVTIFTMMPVFILVYVYRYISEHEKMYLTCIRTISVTYLLGFFMMVKVQPIYTLAWNYHQGMKFLSLEHIIAVACIGSCFGIVVSYIVPYIKMEGSTIEKVCKSALRVIGIVAITHLMFMAVRYKTWDQIRSMTLVCYSVLTGVFMIPCILYRVIIKKYDYSVELGTVGILFSWCIVLYSMVMRKEIRFYYYWARYLMPYLAIVLIFFAMLMTVKKLCCALLMGGLLILIPYTMVITKAQDDTYIQWDTFTSVLKEAETADTVILDTDLMRIFFFPIRAAGNAKVYPLYETLEKTLDYVETGENVMYISRSTREENVNPWLSVKYRDYAEIKMDSRVNCRNIVSGLPQKGAVNTEVYPVTVYQYNESSVYEDNYLFGWSPVDAAGYRWMWGKDAYLECFLRKEDYQMIIHPGYAIPFDSIQADKIAVDVYLNEIFLGTINWTEENAEQEKALDIPQKYITDGCNIVHFASDLWSPAEYGAEDKNTYSFSVGEIELNKVKK